MSSEQEDDLVAESQARLESETVPTKAPNNPVPASPDIENNLIERARREDARHWAEYQRPISAGTLRKQLRIGAARSRMLVSIVRADHAGHQSRTADAEVG